MALVAVSQQAARRELAKRNKLKAEAKVFDLTQFLFAEQLKFVQDPSPNKLAVCSRRSGKTVACAADLVKTAIENEGVVCLYITLSRNNAKKIIWREIKKINRDYALGGEENLSELSITFENGSVIYLSGAKDTNEIEKFRGLALKLVYIDEAQSFREYIRELIDDVLAPALMDYSGTLVLIGTPGPLPVGFFAECAGAVSGRDVQGWARHKWSFWDNPFLPAKSGKTHQEMLDRELKRRGATAQDPSIQREWFGQWVLDSDSLILHYDKNRNHFDTLPDIKPHKWNYILGIDIGFDDADALAVLAWSDATPNTYLVEEKITTKQGITELAEQIEELRKRYDISKMVIDAGGLGKKIAEEIRRQKKLPVFYAEKTLKMQNLAFLDDSLRSGRFKAKDTSAFAQDCFLVEKDRDKTTPDKIVIKSSYHSDIVDAILYAARESPAFTYVEPEKALAKGTKEWADRQQSEMFQVALDHFLEQQNKEKGEY